MNRDPSKGEPLAPLADDYLHCLLHGNRRRATEMILEAVDAGASIRDVYLHVFQRTQYEIGQLWENNELTAADEHYCTAATQLTMSLLYARLFDPARALKNKHPIVVCAVTGELHELGARMVSDFLETEGWDTAYLGASTPTEALIRTLAERRAPLASVSVTLPAHAGRAAELISAIRGTRETEDVKVLVGGYAFRSDPHLWKSVGADGTATDALDAVGVVERMLPRS